MMTSHRNLTFCVVPILAFCAVALGGQTKKPVGPAKQNSLPTLSAQEIFKRVSRSVMVVESLDAEGKVSKFGSGVVIAPLKPWDLNWKTPPTPGKVYKVIGSLVVTNRHVIEDGVSFQVEHGGKKWAAKLIKVDPDHDLAELSVDGLNAPALQVRDSSDLAVGETVYAIGSPEGLELTISEGLISGLRDFEDGRVIQTSAAISPGSSGGGLFDAQGRLVGVTTFYLKEGQSLNFALPAEWTLALNRQPVMPAPTANQSSPEFQALLWLEVGVESAEVAQKAAEAGQRDMATRWFGTAVRALEEFVRLEPGQQQVWSILGMAYNTTGRYDEALRAYQKAVHLQPDDEDAWVGIGDAYTGLGQYNGALDAYRKAVKLKPADSSAWCRMGAAFNGIGEYDKEVSAELKAVGLKPDYEVAWYDLGVGYGALGHYDQAVYALGEAIRLKPDDANAWYRLGLVFKAEGNQPEVVKAYEELKNLNPQLADKFFREEVLP